MPNQATHRMSKEEVREIALEAFRVVHGSGDDGSAYAFNRRNPAEQEGWIRLTNKILGGYWAEVR